MTDFLLELRSEEIPARMQEKARADLARLFTAELEKAGLAASAIETFATPRRLALIARDLPGFTAAVSEETKGPRTSAPPQALEGFLRKVGVEQHQLAERDGVWFAIVEKPGRATAELLAEAVPAIVRAFPWPKSMRWGEASASSAALRWVRPLQGVVALLGEDVVPFEIGGVASGAATVGHRFHHPGIITIGSAADYVEKLRLCHVLVDPAERRRIIEEGAARLAAANGLSVIPDPGLVAENAGLTEWPVPLLGYFDADFLEVPREVIQLTLRTNQKYFVLNDAEGKLAPAFICTANIDASDGGAQIVAGNGKVLAARLSDARFFWEQDLKVTLEDQARKLGAIVFHEKLGTVADKVERVAKLARWLVEEGIVTESPPASGRGELAVLAEQAARLCKADLVTGMVGEFPELQGIMGGYYARAGGRPDAVADAIRDHYKPVGQGDDVPAAPVTVAVSLADKLDTALSFLSIDLGPTGSKDPYAIRRAILAFAALITTNKIRVSLNNLIWRWIAVAFEVMKGDFDSSKDANDYIARFNEQLLLLMRETEHQKFVDIRDEIVPHIKKLIIQPAATRFEHWNDILQLGGPSQFRDLRQIAILSTTDRLKVQQREDGVRHDLIDAVFALGGEDDLVRLLARVKALQAFVETEDGRNLLAGYKRAASMLRKEGWASGAEKALLSYTREIAEAQLENAIESTEAALRSSIAAENFVEAMTSLATLRRLIDAFFENVTVNDPDLAKREARLGLLARIRSACHQVADFSRIEG